MLEKMNSSDLVYQRLHNQKLSSPGFKKPADVVRWLGAVQAQDLNAAKWALALRLHVGNSLGPALIVDGKIAGTWKRTNDKKSVTIEVQLFRSLTDVERVAVAKAADRYAAFLDHKEAQNILFVPVVA